MSKLDDFLIYWGKRRNNILYGCYPIAGCVCVGLIVLVVLTHFVLSIIERVRAW